MTVLQAPAARSSVDRAWDIYYRLRPQIETPDNIGKLVLLDLDSGDYEIDDETNFDSIHRLKARRPAGEFFALRIGYDVSASFSGSMERLPE